MNSLTNSNKKYSEALLSISMACKETKRVPPTSSTTLPCGGGFAAVAGLGPSSVRGRFGAGVDILMGPVDAGGDEQ